jgi:hypothetical protein
MSTRPRSGRSGVPGASESLSGAATALGPTGSGDSGDRGTVLNPLIETSGPISIRRHLISDEQLEMLTTLNREGLSEAFWAFVAGALGALPSAGEALWNAYVVQPPIPLTPIHLCEVAIVLICAALATAMKVVSARRARRSVDLVKRIRNQPVQ